MVCNMVQSSQRYDDMLPLFAGTFSAHPVKVQGSLERVSHVVDILPE